jgi:hypothetical protein
MKHFVLENKWLPGMNHGWGNGYVLIPEGHPLHGVHYDNIDVNVHGGLTFSELVDIDLAKKMHLEQEDIGSWCVGFDTAHWNDTIEKWPERAVVAETCHLKLQLERIAK